MSLAHTLSGLLLSVALLVAAAGTILPYTSEEWVETARGRFKVHVSSMASAEIGKSPVVCIPGANAKLLGEWSDLVAILVDHGHRVAVLDSLKSIKRLADGYGSEYSLDSSYDMVFSKSIIRDIFHAKSAVVIGKSAGGRQASLFAARNPQEVSKLVLIAPAGSAEYNINAGAKRAAVDHTGSTPVLSDDLKKKPDVLLMWARDDPVVPFSKIVSWRAVFESYTDHWRKESARTVASDAETVAGSSSDSQILEYTSEVGGHAVLPEYSKKILEFIEASPLIGRK